MKLFALDNTMGHCVSVGLNERMAMALELDRLGIHYIDGGRPTDPHAREFFAQCELKHARLVTSGQLADLRDAVERDPMVCALLETGAPAIALTCACRESDEQLVGEVVRHLKAHGREVIVRAQDFFESYGANHLVALHVLEVAKIAGADILCLCDSGGKTLPHTLREVCMEVRKRFDGVLGICAHDDSDLALANTLDAVEQGFTLVEGSVRGCPVDCPTRSGRVNLGSLLTNLELKQGHTVIGAENIARISHTADFFAGAADGPVAADESPVHPFVPVGYEVISHSSPDGSSVSSATVTVRIGDLLRCESEDGTGAVEAIERALRQCLFAIYPSVSDLKVVGCRFETPGPVRVTVEWNECGNRWSTVGVSRDLLHAVWIALSDGFRLQLIRAIERTRELTPQEVELWAV